MPICRLANLLIDAGRSGDAIARNVVRNRLHHLRWAIPPNALRLRFFGYRLWPPNVSKPDVRVSEGAGDRLLVALAHAEADAMQLLMRSAGA
jgi:hypothetical protein